MEQIEEERRSRVGCKCLLMSSSSALPAGVGSDGRAAVSFVRTDVERWIVVRRMEMSRAPTPKVEERKEGVD